MKIGAHIPFRQGYSPVIRPYLEGEETADEECASKKLRPSDANLSILGVFTLVAP